MMKLFGFSFCCACGKIKGLFTNVFALGLDSVSAARVEKIKGLFTNVFALGVA
jgi:hypothetical protein